MITSKDGFLWQVRRWDFEYLKDWVCQTRILAAFEKDWFVALWGGRQYVAAVDLLDENEVFFWKPDYLTKALGIWFWKLENTSFLNE